MTTTQIIADTFGGALIGEMVNIGVHGFWPKMRAKKYLKTTLEYAGIGALLGALVGVTIDQVKQAQGFQVPSGNIFVEQNALPGTGIYY